MEWDCKWKGKNGEDKSFSRYYMENIFVYFSGLEEVDYTKIELGILEFIEIEVFLSG